MKVIKGNCIEVLKTLKDNSIDSIVTDPPYEIGFMGKSWDSSGIANNPEMWAECLRVLKPGGYLLSFSATRTYHRMAVGVEDAGFEIRDMIEWVYGSGFPKSHNIGKAVDKLQGNEREVYYKNPNLDGAIRKHTKASGEFVNSKKVELQNGLLEYTKGTSEYEGWGTALKPAHEPICMARKPLAEKTVAENCLKWGTGGINIDESRVEAKPRKTGTKPTGSDATGSGNTLQGSSKNRQAEYDEQNLGRFPANLIHDNSEEVRACFPDTGISKKGSNNGTKKSMFGMLNTDTGNMGFGDQGNASRYFKSIIYQAKPSKKERNAGCEGLEEKVTKVTNMYEMVRDNGTMREVAKKQNNHPTVKPIALMEYLINMVTPKGGVVLDPFMGSGTTGCAAVKNGFDFIGIDLDEEYIKISTSRIEHYKKEKESKLF